MADYGRKRRGELLRTLFLVLLDHPEGIPAKDAINGTADRLELSEHEKGVYKDGARRFDKILRFQTINAVRAGWMVKDKGTWTVTDDGRKAVEEHKDPEAFMLAAETLFRAWAKDQPPKEKSEPDDTALERLSLTVEEAEERAFSEVADFLAVMDPYDLQELVAGLLRGMGYHVAWVAPPGKDRGLDILAFRDPLGTQDPRIKVQVKREKDRVNVQGLRAFMSILNPGDVGVFVNVGGFTPDAESEARHSETRRVTLIDRSDLFDLLVQHYESIPATDRELMPLKAVHYLATSTTAEDE